MSAERPGSALEQAVDQPGSIWCYGHDPAAGGTLAPTPPRGELPFRWLHLNLADQRSLRWLTRRQALPPPLLAALAEADIAPRLIVGPDGLFLVVQDFERGLEPGRAGEIGALGIALAGGLLVTGRARPLRAMNLVHERLTRGAAPKDGIEALDLLLSSLVDSLAGLLFDLNADLLDAEADLLADADAVDSRALVAARRRLAELHRLTGGLRATLRRLAAEPLLPPRLGPIARDLEHRLAGLDADIVAAQQQLRLLRDELDLQAAQRTNQNVYLLSVMTALLLPATLVTGFFGMNTGGLPFATGAHGTLLATIVALLSAAGSYLLLRRMGLIRRG